jgi:hypothetical protein
MLAIRDPVMPGLTRDAGPRHPVKQTKRYQRVDFIAFVLDPARCGVPIRRISAGGPRRRRGDDELEYLYEIIPDSSGARAGLFFGEQGFQGFKRSFVKFRQFEVILFLVTQAFDRGFSLYACFTHGFNLFKEFANAGKR